MDDLTSQIPKTLSGWLGLAGWIAAISTYLWSRTHRLNDEQRKELIETLMQKAEVQEKQIASQAEQIANLQKADDERKSQLKQLYDHNQLLQDLVTGKAQNEKEYRDYALAIMQRVSLYLDNQEQKPRRRKVNL